MSTKDALIVLMAVGVVSFLAGMFFIHYILGCIMSGLVLVIGGGALLSIGSEEGWFK
jgi:hypothetical protein